MDVGAHVRDGANIDHHHVVNLGKPLLVEPAGQHHLGGWHFCNQRGRYKYILYLYFIDQRLHLIVISTKANLAD